MIKNVKFFLNNNIDTIKNAKLIRNQIEQNGFITSSNNYDTVVSIGDYQLFNRMLKTHNYNEYLTYCFFDDNRLTEQVTNELINKIKNNNYNIKELELMKMTVNTGKNLLIFFSNDKIVVKSIKDDRFKANLYIEGRLFEQNDDSGLLFTKTSYKTGKSSIIYSKSSIFQIVPLRHQRMLTEALMVPNSKKIDVEFLNKNIMIDVDNDSYYYNNLSGMKIEKINKKIKCIGLNTNWYL